MTEFLIFTILATSVALYSILPDHRKSRVGYVLRSPKWSLAIISLFLLIVSIYLFDQYLILTETELGKYTQDFPLVSKYISGSSRFPLVFTQILFSLILAGCMLIIFFSNWPKSGSQHYLMGEIRKYFHSEDFDELTELIEDNYQLLIPEETSPVPEAASLTKDYLLNPRFADVHPTLAPDLGIKIIVDPNIPVSYRQDFVKIFLATQIRTEHSQIYQEVPENRVLEGRWRYKLYEDNKLLFTLLSDMSRSEELKTYLAISTPIREILEDQYYRERDPYNEPRLRLSPDSEYAAKYDPIYIGLRCLDLLVVRAIEDDYDDPMGISAFMGITRQICENYEITPFFEYGQEWSNDYELFLYTIFEQLSDWIRVVIHDFDHSAEISIGLETISTEWTGSLTKSATICIAICHKNVLTCDEITDEFKDYITMIIARLLMELRKHDITELPYWYNKQLLYSLEARIGSSSQTSDYQRELRGVLNRQELEIKMQDHHSTGTFDALKNLV